MTEINKSQKKYKKEAEEKWGKSYNKLLLENVKKYLLLSRDSRQPKLSSKKNPLNEFIMVQDIFHNYQNQPP